MHEVVGGLLEEPLFTMFCMRQCARNGEKRSREKKGHLSKPGETGSGSIQGAPVVSPRILKAFPQVFLSFRRV